MADELLPCPFCGSTPALRVYKLPNTDRFVALVVCDECGAYKSARNDDEADAEDEAARSWNKRYERTCHAIPDEPRWAACECSVCGGALDFFNKFCPCCGAKVMRDEQR